MAHVSDIKNWLALAQKKGCRYLIISHDTFDFGDYPIYVHSQDNFWEKMPRKFGTSSSVNDLSNQAHEVYDLNMSLDDQLKEKRAWHPPEKVS